MRRLFFLIAVVVLLSTGAAAGQDVKPFDVAPFGKIRIYGATGSPAHVVIFVSGEEGWDRTAEELAARMVSLHCVVIGVDAREYLGRLVAADNCTYPGADVENLSRFTQQKLNLPGYMQPILVGYSAGAALVYATLLQAPTNVLVGGVSLGFCPKTPLTKGVCRGLGVDWDKAGKLLLPPADLRTPWIVVAHPDGDPCSSEADAFVKQLKNVQVIRAPERGTNGEVAWGDRLTAALSALADREQRLKALEQSSLGNLPVVEVPAKGDLKEQNSDVLAVMLSGDGGWAGLDHELGNTISASGIPLVGLNSLKYFWTPRTPDQAAHDLALIIDHYLAAWGKKRVLLLGYSFGADVLPFLVNRLPEEVRARIVLVALLGASESAEFEFHLTNWFEGTSSDARPTLPETKKMQVKKVLCMSGEGEPESLCRSLDPTRVEIISLPGGHHFAGDYRTVADKVLAAAGLARMAPRVTNGK